MDAANPVGQVNGSSAGASLLLGEISKVIFPFSAPRSAGWIDFSI